MKLSLLNCKTLQQEEIFGTLMNLGWRKIIHENRIDNREGWQSSKARNTFPILSWKVVLFLIDVHPCNHQSTVTAFLYVNSLC